MQLDGIAGDMNLLYPLIVPISINSAAFLILQFFSLMDVFSSVGIVFYYGHHLLKINFYISPLCIPQLACR